jgi:integration host factor subunit alpha
MGACTKNDIMRSVFEAGFTKARSAELVETVIDLVKARLVSGEDVLISGFGKFCVRQKRERRGRNPATGDRMMLKPRTVVTFHCSGKLRKRLNQ